MPPQSSSHTADGNNVDGAAVEQAPYVIRITRLSLVAAFMLLICVSFPALGWPAALGWLFLLPISVTVWILRNQTTVTSSGLETRSVFAAKSIPWTDIKGVRFPKRGWARADLISGKESVLPAVGFDRLQELAEASGGRIPDPYAAVPDVVESNHDSDPEENSESPRSSE